MIDWRYLNVYGMDEIIFNYLYMESMLGKKKDYDPYSDGMDDLAIHWDREESCAALFFIWHVKQTGFTIGNWSVLIWIGIGQRWT